jgi:hypothetical protein
MRKSIFCIMVLFSFLVLSVKAQSIEFQYMGQSLEDGATVSIAAEVDVFGELSCETNPSSNPTGGLVLKMPSGSKGNVTATLEILDNSLNASRLQWCMGGECTVFGENTSLTKSFTADNMIPVLFDAGNIKSEGILKATLTIKYLFDKLTVNILFTNGDSSGINSPKTPSSRTNGVYNLNGSLILKKANAFQIESLPSGYYLVNGKKMYIR